jgi:hypothetical protein
MQSAEAVTTLVQEGRFALVKDDGRVIHFLLTHDASLKPQDLPLLKRDQRRVRVDFTEPSRLLAHVADTLRTADDISTERIEP